MILGQSSHMPARHPTHGEDDVGHVPLLRDHLQPGHGFHVAYYVPHPCRPVFLHLCPGSGVVGCGRAMQAGNASRLPCRRQPASQIKGGGPSPASTGSRLLQPPEPLRLAHPWQLKYRLRRRWCGLHIHWSGVGCHACCRNWIARLSCLLRQITPCTKQGPGATGHGARSLQRPPNTRYGALVLG